MREEVEKRSGLVKFRENGKFFAGGKQNGFQMAGSKYIKTGQCQEYVITAEKESHTFNKVKPLTFS